MNHVHVLETDLRHAPRVCLPKGQLLAKLPPPTVWNWFTDNRLVAILNLSSVGMGIESDKPIEGQLILRLNSNQVCYQVCGTICHQKSTHNGFYYGIDCANAHETLEDILLNMRSERDVFCS